MAKCAREDCGAMALTDESYCRHHGPDDDQPEAVVIAYERKAIDTLTSVIDDARSKGQEIKAARVLLEHARGSGDE